MRQVNKSKGRSLECGEARDSAFAFENGVTFVEGVTNFFLVDDDNQFVAPKLTVAIDTSSHMVVSWRLE